MSDTFTDFLKRGIGPRQGMQRIPFPTESYQHPSKPLSAKRLLNLYSETEPSDARSQAALISTPGLVFRENLNGGPVVQFNTELLGGFYAVSGGHAFRNIAGVTSDLGAVGTPVDPLTDPTRLMTTIACSPTDVVICVPPNAFTATHIGALAPVAGGFPGANSVCFQDGYFVYSQTGDGTQWFISHLDDPTLYDALDFATLEGMNNVIMRSVTHRGELWHLGYAGIEVWYDAGGLAITGTDFPFLRRSGAIIPYGVEPRSVALKVDGSIFWVSVDGIVYRSQGYAALRVSTHAIEAIIETSFPNLAVGFTYTQLGHIFYGFTLTDKRMGRPVERHKWQRSLAGHRGRAGRSPPLYRRCQRQSLCRRSRRRDRCRRTGGKAGDAPIDLQSQSAKHEPGRGRDGGRRRVLSWECSARLVRRRGKYLSGTAGHVGGDHP